MPRERYARWAPTYPPAAHNSLMQTEQGAVAPILRTLRPGRALDVGTGSGRYLPELAGSGAAFVVGLDFCEAMLRRAPLEWLRICGDARRLPFAAGCFDLVNASLIAGDMADLSPWLRGLASVLRAGGDLVYSDFHPVWERNGWRRTFQAQDGTTVDLPFVAHSIDEHWCALRAAGFEVVTCQEVPLAGDSEADVRFRRRWGDPPVLIVLHARRERH